MYLQFGPPEEPHLENRKIRAGLKTARLLATDPATGLAAHCTAGMTTASLLCHHRCKDKIEGRFSFLLEVSSTTYEAGYMPSFRKGVSSFQYTDVLVCKQPVWNKLEESGSPQFIIDDICNCFYSCKHTLTQLINGTTAGEHAVQQIRTEILRLVCYLGGLAEGQRVVLIW